MSAKWTEQQLNAISEKNGNILVSAAAGSGKTAVLIERILRIIKEKTDIDKMLIVTFTNAAAAEMRERLYVSLQKELDSPSITPEMTRRLSRQQILLSKSYITTIHAFCQTVIKSNTTESGIDSSYRIGDTGEINILKKDIMDEIIENHYAQNDEAFLRLIEIYSGYRSDKELVELIFSLYDFAQSSPNPQKWLEEQKKSFDPELVKDFAQTNWFKEIIKDLYISFLAFYENIKSLYDTALQNEIVEYISELEKDTKTIFEFTQFLKSVCNRDKNDTKWEDVFNEFSKIEFNKLVTMSKKRKEAYDLDTLEIIDFIRNSRKNLKEKIKKSFTDKIGKNIQAPMKDISILQPDMEKLIDITIEFCKAYADGKAEKRLLDFNDLEHIALKTLSIEDENGTIRKSKVAEGYSELFEEVYIDEYQDTNELQEAILTLVSRNDTDKIPNTFKVGDVKQSIYGFRQARPDIFIDKFKKYGQDGKRDKLIILNKNFRSRDSVLRSVNNLFSNIMTENTCSIEYNEAEYLNFGAMYYPETDTDTETEIHLCTKNKDYERELVAEIIENLIKNKHQVYDKALGKMRDVTYKDIVILLRARTNGRLYTQKLKQHNIPAYYSEEGGFFSNPEIAILLSFMKVVDNPLQDIHLLATMRNIYGFTDTQLVDIKNFSNKVDVECKYFYDMCVAFDGDEYLRDKILIFLERLNEIREISRHSSVSELLWILMHENHFYDNLKNGPLGQLHESNVNLLYSKAISYDESTNKGLFRFIYYFDKLKKRQGDMAEASGASENMNVVRVMTIHKSKGLEFPVVILADTGKKFNDIDKKSLLLKHRLAGLGPTCYLQEEKVKYPSVMKFCVLKRIEADNIAEEMRVLYVAMTRASEKLIITGTIDDDFDDYMYKNKAKLSAITGKPLEYHILDTNKYIDWIMMCPTTDEKHVFFHDEKGNINDNNELKEKCEEVDNDEEENEITVSVLQPPKMTFYKERYEKKENIIPAKISVSDLKRLFEDENEFSVANKEVQMNELPDFHNEDAISNSFMTSSQMGTAIHTCLQLTDYNKIGILSIADARKYAEEIVLEAVDKGFFGEKEAKLIDVDLLANYYCSNLALRISKADEVYKEIPFTQLETVNGVETAVQGVIDILIKENDKYTVIDFKTDKRPDAEKYKMQLYYYGQCVKKIFGREPEKIIYFIKYNKEVIL